MAYDGINKFYNSILTCNQDCGVRSRSRMIWGAVGVALFEGRTVGAGVTIFCSELPFFKFFGWCRLELYIFDRWSLSL